MKKVGIVTYHFMHNYGTMLQAYALQKKIENIGFNAEIIDYRLADKQNTRFNVVFIRFKRFFVYLYKFKFYYKKYIFKKISKEREKRFNLFYEEYIKVSSKQYKTLAELKDKPPIYDVYVTGSDQTWNPTTMSNSDAYFLSFVDNHKVKVSYAPSIGVSVLSKQQMENFKLLISDYKFVSCREKTGSKLLEKAINRGVKTVLDPTFLLSPEEWISISKPVQLDIPYILCYFLGNNEKHRKYAKKISRELGISLLFIVNSPIDVNVDEEKVFDVGPSEFIYLINNAQFVLTDSFHGTAFSINFNKNFYCLPKFEKINKLSENSRIEDLLSLVGLSDRLILDEHYVDISEIDYNEVNKRLLELKSDSNKFLNKALGGYE